MMPSPTIGHLVAPPQLTDLAPSGLLKARRPRTRRRPSTPRLGTGSGSPVSMMVRTPAAMQTCHGRGVRSFTTSATRRVPRARPPSAVSGVFARAASSSVRGRAPETSTLGGRAMRRALPAMAGAVDLGTHATVGDPSNLLQAESVLISACMCPARPPFSRRWPARGCSFALERARQRVVSTRPSAGMVPCAHAGHARLAPVMVPSG